MSDSAEAELRLRIILETPPAGVDFGLQKGSGSDYETVQTQRSSGRDLHFEATARVRRGKDGQPNFLGEFVQGPVDERFIYIDIGTYAGQSASSWSRRLKIPLRGITSAMIKKHKTFEARVPGTGRDGGPNCATVRPFAGWKPGRSGD